MNRNTPTNLHELKIVRLTYSMNGCSMPNKCCESANTCGLMLED